MGILTIHEIENKIRNCLDTLASKECTDKLYIVFVVCEYLKYVAALRYGVHAANKAALFTVFSFGKTVMLYRNAFAHSESTSELLSTIDKLREYSNEICSEFSGDVYFKVYDALN